jgi:Crinkler effector protein N-terminal domain
MSLSLNCLVLGDEPERMFTVKIPKTDNVSIFKKLIKEKKAPHLNHHAASDLDLWKVDLHMDELGEEPVHINLDTYTKLSPPWLKLSSFFERTVDDEHLHVIAKAPGTSHSSSSWNLI